MTVLKNTVKYCSFRATNRLKAIREEGGPNAATPVIAVTADVSPERRLACNEAGFSSLIEKPIRPRALVAALADVLIAGSVTEADERKLA